MPPTTPMLKHWGKSQINAHQAMARKKKASLHRGGVGWLDYLEIIVISVRGQLLCLGV